MMVDGPGTGFLEMQGANVVGGLPTEAPLEPSLEDRAYDALLEWLVQGKGAPGQPIPLREFAKALGMSRTPLRTALGRLLQQRLVAYDARLGFTATVPSAGDLHDLFEIRIMFETHALERYFDAANPALLERYGISQLADEIWDIANSPEINEDVGRRFWDIDMRFHRAIVSLGRNPRLLESWDLLHVNIVISRAGLRARMTRERFTVSAREHLTIVEAMKTGAAEYARDLLRKHLLRVCDQTIRFMMSPDERDLSVPRRRELGTQTAVIERTEDLE